jgi:hypothetical protein
MATSNEYAYVAAKLSAELTTDVGKFVPAMFQSMIPADAIPHLATACAHVSADALDAYRALHGQAQEIKT